MAYSSGKPNLSKAPIRPPMSSTLLPKPILPPKPEPVEKPGYLNPRDKRLFSGHSEYVKGPGSSLENDLKLILRKPGELAKLNTNLRRARLSPVKVGDIPEVIQELLHAEFSPDILRDRRVTTDEIQYPSEPRKHYLADQEVRKEQGYRPYRRIQEMRAYFDDLLGKKH